MGMPPALMMGDATQMPRSAGDNQLRLVSLTTCPPLHGLRHDRFRPP